MSSHGGGPYICVACCKPCTRKSVAIDDAARMTKDAMAAAMRLTIGQLELDRSRVQIKLRNNTIIVVFFPRHLRADGGTTDAPRCDSTARPWATHHMPNGIRPVPRRSSNSDKTLQPSSVHRLTTRSSPARRGGHNGRAALLFNNANTDLPQARRKDARRKTRSHALRLAGGAPAAWSHRMRKRVWR